MRKAPVPSLDSTGAFFDAIQKGEGVRLFACAINKVRRGFLDTVHLILELVAGLPVNKVTSLFNSTFDGILMAVDQSFSLALDIVKNRQ